MSVIIKIKGTFIAFGSIYKAQIEQIIEKLGLWL